MCPLTYDWVNMQVASVIGKLSMYLMCVTSHDECVSAAYTHGVCRGTFLPGCPHLNFAAEDPRVFAK